MEMTVTCNICNQLLITVKADVLTDVDVEYYEKAMMCLVDGNNGTNVVAVITGS
jgi:hypothetical protein